MAGEPVLRARQFDGGRDSVRRLPATGASRADRPRPGNEVVCTKETWPDPAVLDRLFTGASSQDLIAYTLNDLAPGRAAVVSSFGADSAILLHMVAGIAPDTPVLFLETGKHFPETLAYRDRLAAELGLTDVRSIRPDGTRLAARDPRGDLNGGDPDLCCAIRKEQPLEAALSEFDVWINGRRRGQTGDRRAMPLVERDGGRLKVNPLAGWDGSDISAYRTIHELAEHPLRGRGYLSIGCAPCTSPVGADEDQRAGRWRGTNKTECGIHVSRNGETVRVLAAGQSMTDSKTIWTRDGFADDAWHEIADDEAVPAGRQVLVPAERWRDLREGKLPDDRRIGVRLSADDRVEDLAPDVELFGLIALDFPAFTDGRSYSAARLLRERYGYSGDLRAQGDVLLDQIPLMLRCGFSSFAISHGPTRRALAEGRLPEVPIYLQPSGGQAEAPLGDRPWMRIRA